MRIFDRNFYQKSQTQKMGILKLVNSFEKTSIFSSEFEYFQKILGIFNVPESQKNI